MIQLGHNLEMEVLIEGVETIEQADWLAREGCDYFQGYYFSRPLVEGRRVVWIYKPVAIERKCMMLDS